MKKIILIIISLFFIPKVFAVTLSEALTQAYKNNTELNAERENIKVSEEDLNISKEYLPTLTLSGSKSQEDTNKPTINPERCCCTDVTFINFYNYRTNIN